MQASSTLAAMQAAEALRAEGVNVVDFGAGEPDFDTPENIKRAAAEAMRDGKTKYTATAGIASTATSNYRFLRATVWYRLMRAGSDGDVRGKQAIFNAVVSLIDPGDEVLMPRPYWVTFPEVVVFARGTPVFIDTEETRFCLNCRTCRTRNHTEDKLIILNSPCNPSGRVIPSDEFRTIM